jgi:integrase
MASIKKVRKKDGTYSYQVRAYGPEGRQRRTFRTLQAGQKWSRGIEGAKDQGLALPSQMLLSEWWAQWFSAQDADLNTLVDYESLWRTHVNPTFGSRPLNKILPLHRDEWAKQLRTRLSDSRARKARLVLDMMMDAAVVNRLIPSWHRTRWKSERAGQTRKPHFILTPSEVATTASNAANPTIVTPQQAVAGYDTFVMVAVDAALRPGEIRALRRQSCLLDHPEGPRLLITEAAKDVYGYGVLVGETKTHQSRVVRLSPSVSKLLARHLRSNVARDEDAWIFTSPEGQLLNWNNFRSSVFYKALDAAGLRRRGLYELRHTGASILGRAGIPIHELKEHMGHATITTTEQYLHFYSEPGGVASTDLVTFKQQDIFRTLMVSFFEGPPAYTRADQDF